MYGSSPEVIVSSCSRTRVGSRSRPHEGGGRGAQTAHGRGGVDTAAHDVAHDEGRPVAAQGEDVVPVAADFVGRLCGLVPGSDLQAGQVGWMVGEQAALQGLGGVAHALVGAGVVDAHRGAGGQFGGDGEVVLVEGPWVAGAGQPQEAKDGGASNERDGHVGVHSGAGQQRCGVVVAGDTCQVVSVGVRDQDR